MFMHVFVRCKYDVCVGVGSAEGGLRIVCMRTCMCVCVCVCVCGRAALLLNCSVSTVIAQSWQPAKPTRPPPGLKKKKSIHLEINNHLRLGASVRRCCLRNSTQCACRRYQSPLITVKWERKRIVPSRFSQYPSFPRWMTQDIKFYNFQIFT